MDGWWAEAYRPEVGWAIGDGRDRGDDAVWDATESNALYDVLEHDVIPQFYTSGPQGMPTVWIDKIRLSMATLTPEYSATRAVCQYVKESYLAAASAYRKRTARGCESAEALVNWRRQLDREWHNVRIGPVNVTSGEGWNDFRTAISLGELAPEWVEVELFADGGDAGPERHEMTLSAGHDVPVYTGRVSSIRPPHDYTIRVIPRFPGAILPLEATHITWQY